MENSNVNYEINTPNGKTQFDMFQLSDDLIDDLINKTITIENDYYNIISDIIKKDTEYKKTVFNGVNLTEYNITFSCNILNKTSVHIFDKDIDIC